MQIVDLKQLEATAMALAKQPMTRRDRLLHWSALIRKTPAPMMLYHLLEQWTSGQLAHECPATHPSHYQPNAFTVASGDSVLREAGLGSDKPEPAITFQDHMEFFGVNQAQLHEFSCNCGGAIGNDVMADRIERLAGPAPAGAVVDSSSWTGR